MEKDTSIEEFADAAVEILRGAHHSDLEPFDAYAARMKGEMVKQLQAYRTRLTHGYQLLLEELGKEKAPSPRALGMIRP